jgi:chitodextrinase
MNRPLRAIAAAAVLVAAGVVAVVTSAPAHADVQICDQYGSTTIQGRYVVQNNRWGTTAQQCINVTDTGFSITRQDGVGSTSGAPVSYPSVFLGCHYTNCSPGTNLPIQVSQISSATSNISYNYVSGATYNASFDIWLDPTPKRDGVNQMEIMIWFNRQGNIQPIGSVVGNGTVGGRTWEVWRGNNGGNNVISYVAPSPINSWNFSVLDFINDTVARGAITRSWYLTSIQAGFEPWIGGVGLGVNSFSATVNGGGNPGDTQAPTTPGQPNATNVTSNSAQLSWSASSDNVGVTGYDVYRQQGGGQATLLTTVSGTSYAATGLSPSTTYGFSVRARDAAGNQSAASATRSVTTQSGPGGPTSAPPPPPGACRVGYGVNQWNGGFTANVTVTNTGGSAINGWTLTWTYPGNQQVGANPWNAQVTQSGSAVTARNLAYNGNLAPNASTSFGFNGSFSGSNPAPTSFALNGAACTVG